MRIDTFRHTSIPIKYAAILECSDDKGNTLLRAWNRHSTTDGTPARPRRRRRPQRAQVLRPGGPQELASRSRSATRWRSRPGQVPPRPGDRGQHRAGRCRSRRPVDGDGAERSPRPFRAPTGETRPAFNRGPQVGPGRGSHRRHSDGDAQTAKGKDRGGEDPHPSGGGLPGNGGPGEGHARISAGDIRFRSWTDAATSDLCLALTRREDLTATSNLWHSGPAAAVEDDYTLPISRRDPRS